MWQTKCFVILDSFLLFYPSPSTHLTTQKIKILTHVDIIILHICTTNYNHDVWFLRYEQRQTESFWTIFCPFTYYQPEKLKFWKKWKNHLEILSLHLCTIMTIIWYMVPEIWNAMNKIVCHSGFFCPFTPLSSQEIKITKKMKKNPWRYYHFTYVHHTWLSYYVLFLRYGARRTEFFVILDHF